MRGGTGDENARQVSICCHSAAARQSGRDGLYQAEEFMTLSVTTKSALTKRIPVCRRIVNISNLRMIVVA